MGDIDIVLGRALYDFSPNRKDNLSFKKGDIITVIAQDDSGWWSGADSSGRIGLFPENYVELNIDVKDEYPVAKALYDFEKHKDEDLEFVEDEEIIVLRMVSDEWWEGKNLKGDIGIFPASYVELTDEVDVTTAAEEQKRWADIENQAKEAMKAAAERRKKAEEELEREKKALEEANKKAAEARAEAEREKQKLRDKKQAEELERVKKEEAEIARKREEAEKRHKEAREKLKSMRLEEDVLKKRVQIADKKKKEKKKQSMMEENKLSTAAAGQTKPKKYMQRRKVNYVKPQAAGSRFKNLGGGDKCKKCGKGVGLADKVLGPANTIYHKDCFRCSKCAKRLKPGEFKENKDLPYCSQCHAQNFGPKGFGFGGAIAQNDQVKAKTDGQVESQSQFMVAGGGGYKTYSMRLKEKKEGKS